MNAHSNDTGPHPDPNEELETPLTSQESISGRRIPRALGSRVVGMRGLALSWRGGNQPTPRTHLVEARAEGHPSNDATGMTRMSTPGELHSPGHCTHSKYGHEHISFAFAFAFTSFTRLVFLLQIEHIGVSLLSILTSRLSYSALPNAT